LLNSLEPLPLRFGDTGKRANLRLGYDSLGGYLRGKEKTAVDSPTSKSINESISVFLSPLPRPYSVSVSLFASACLLQAGRPFYRNTPGNSKAF